MNPFYVLSVDVIGAIGYVFVMYKTDTIGHRNKSHGE